MSYQQNMRYAQNNALQQMPREMPTLKDICLLIAVFALWALIGFVVYRYAPIVWNTCKILAGV